MSNAKQLRNASTRAWSTRTKNGAAILQLTMDAIDHAFGEAGDWTVLAHHIRKGIDSGATREVANIKLVVRKVAEGATIATDEKQPTGLRMSFKNAVKNNWATSVVQELIDRNVSISGTAIRAALEPEKEEKAKSDFDVKKWAERQKKAHPDQLEAMIAALQALR